MSKKLGFNQTARELLAYRDTNPEMFDSMFHDFRMVVKERYVPHYAKRFPEITEERIGEIVDEIMEKMFGSDRVKGIAGDLGFQRQFNAIVNGNLKKELACPVYDSDFCRAIRGLVELRDKAVPEGLEGVAREEVIKKRLDDPEYAKAYWELYLIIEDRYLEKFTKLYPDIDPQVVTELLQEQFQHMFSGSCDLSVTNNPYQFFLASKGNSGIFFDRLLKHQAKAGSRVVDYIDPEQLDDVPSTIMSPDVQVAFNGQMERVDAARAVKLMDREHDLLLRGLVQEAEAKALGISGSRVGQIKRRAIMKADDILRREGLELRLGTPPATEINSGDSGISR